MKRKNNFAKVLYYIASIAYYLSFVALGLQILTTFMTDESYGFKSRNAVGYSLPVDINLHIPDSTIVYKDKNYSAVITTKRFSQTNEEQIKSIVNNPVYEKTILANQIKMENKNGQNINSEFGHVIIQSSDITGDLYVNPQSTTFRILLELRTYVLFLTMAFVFWHVAQFFKILSNDFSFNQIFKRKLYLIAGTLLSYQAIIIAINIACRHYINKAAIISSVVGIEGEKEIISFHPLLQIDTTMLLVSLSIICIAKLLDYGYALQNENELTI